MAGLRDCGHKGFLYSCSGLIVPVKTVLYAQRRRFEAKISLLRGFLGVADE